jgi:hypothetical protein
LGSVPKIQGSIVEVGRPTLSVRDVRSSGRRAGGYTAGRYGLRKWLPHFAGKRWTGHGGKKMGKDKGRNVIDKGIRGG